MRREEDILNLKFYKGTDIYSDGDIEDELLTVARNNDDLEEYLKTDNRWPFLYHFSPIRENLLEWYDFNPEANLLEIGSGCGAMSGLFCRKVKRVVGIDQSKRRSQINVEKNKYPDNLEIMVGNFNDIEIDEKFEYVTLIGVLEYAYCYVEDEDSFASMLKRVKNFLKPGGTLILAIDNKFGFKYWAGAAEDHTGMMFEGITGYHNTDKVRTFSRRGIEELLVRSGYSNNRFYYPMPGYKLPTEVFSEDIYPSQGNMRYSKETFDRDRYSFFDENAAFNEVCSEGLFTTFANSFLVFAKE